MNYAARGAFWCLLYLSLVIVPLIFAALGPFPAGRGFWREFAVSLGFVGLAMWGSVGRRTACSINSVTPDCFSEINSDRLDALRLWNMGRRPCTGYPAVSDMSGVDGGLLRNGIGEPFGVVSWAAQVK